MSDTIGIIANVISLTLLVMSEILGIKNGSGTCSSILQLLSSMFIWIGRQIAPPENSVSEPSPVEESSTSTIGVRVQDTAIPLESKRAPWVLTNVP